MNLLPVVAALVLTALTACSSLTSGPGGRGATGPTGTRAALEAEQERLAELFEGTPVVFAMQPDGSLRVAVPLRYSFDPGRHAVKPPLAAVLDRVASSQRKEPTRFTVSAPADPNSRGLSLATDRASSTRDYLVARGIGPTRFSIAALQRGDAVEIVVAEDAPH